jgi:hypothetical protein
MFEKSASLIQQTKIPKSIATMDTGFNTYPTFRKGFKKAFVLMDIKTVPDDMEERIKNKEGKSITVKPLMQVTPGFVSLIYFVF